MSIDALIQANTEALLANTEAIKLLEASLVGRSGGPKPCTTGEKPKVKGTTAQDAVKPTDEKSEKVAGTADVKEERHQSAIAEAAHLVKTREAEREVTPYETVRALVLKLAPTQRDAIKALNAKHGIANLKVLLDKEDDFSTVNDQAKLEAVYADLQALEG